MMMDGWFMQFNPFGLVMGVVGILFSILIIVLIVAAIVALLRHPGPVRERPRTNALLILEERYAKGEVSQQEFLERRAVLLGEEPHGGA